MIKRQGAEQNTLGHGLAGVWSEAAIYFKHTHFWFVAFWILRFTSEINAPKSFYSLWWLPPELLQEQGSHWNDLAPSAKGRAPSSSFESRTLNSS